MRNNVTSMKSNSHSRFVINDFNESFVKNGTFSEGVSNCITQAASPRQSRAAQRVSREHLPGSFSCTIRYQDDPKYTTKPSLQLFANP